MTPRNLLYTVILLLLSFQARAYDGLYVLDPLFWNQDQGTIEEAQITIHPRGVYMEVGMYLTLSGKDTWFREEGGKGNPLEIVLDFGLPENAMVIDSWLWINEDIIQADIKDRWSAAAIYEDIVGRRQDPSILFKQGENQYQLRVYPLQSDSTRRVKVSYLVPGEWSNGQVSVPLPMGLLNTSRTPLAEVQIQSFLNGDFKNPRITQLEDMAFENATHATLGAHQKLTVVTSQLKSSLDFVVDAPMKNGVFLSYSEGEENYYQLAFLPEEVLQLKETNPKKLAVLVDYTTRNSTDDKAALLVALENQLLQSLGSKDSFNLLLSQTSINPIHPTWIPGDAETIKEYFEELKTLNFSNFSNLPNLMTKGIEYIQQQGTGGNLLLVSNADQLAEPEVANILIEELTAMMEEQNIPIYVVDYQNENLRYSWFNGNNYLGNEYFYTNITRQTGGTFNNIREYQSLSASLKESAAALSNIQGILDVHTTLEEGFCYGRYDIKKSNSFAAVNRPIIQVGKFEGDFPYEIELSGVINEQFFGENLSIPKSDAIASSDADIDEVIWAGNYIQSLEKETRTNATVNEIIKWSLEHRVLSFYTAFLALEVAQGGVVCEDCLDETNLEQILVEGTEGPTRTETDEEIVVTDPDGNTIDDVFDAEGGGDGGAPTGAPANDGDVNTATNDILVDSLLSIQASPNPFSVQTTLTVTLGNSVDTDELSFSIYGIDGRKVKTFAPASSTSKSTYQFTWNGTDEQGQLLPKGMYLFNVRTKLGQKNLKLLYLR